MLLDLIRQLKPLDRQIILLYLEGEAAETMAEVTGLSAANIATKICRLKRVLRQKYLEGVTDAAKYANRTHAREAMRYGPFAGETRCLYQTSPDGRYDSPRRSISLQRVQNRPAMDQAGSGMDAGCNHLPVHAST
jgi:hypothetical protein